MDPSAWPQLDPYPSLRMLVKEQIDMQFADLRALLRLPVEQVEPGAGCNLITATLDFNIVAGASVLFYDSLPRALAERGDRGRRFTEVLETYYPWSDKDLEPAEAAKALYEWARNPLAHALGVGKVRRVFPGAPVVRGQPVAVWFAKGPLSPSQVEFLATTRTRDAVLDPTVALSGGELEVDVVTLSWGVHELLRRLFEDQDQVERAEITARALLRG